LALSIPTIGRKKPVTLQTEQQKVATPSTLASRKTAIQAPPKPAAPPPPSPPREAAPGSTYGAPRPPGALQPPGPNQRPTTPGAGAPPVGTYEAPEKPDMTPPPAEVPETVTMTMDQDVAGTMGNAPPGGLFEAVTEGPPSPPPSEDELDAQIRQLMGDLISGKGMGVDTSEEEALIKQLMQDQIGQSLVDQRARMGRAGFGASGALAAMEGDIQRQAAQRATQETLATRRQAEQDAIERALSAIGVDVEKRREGRQASFDEEFLNALKSSMEQEDTAAGGGPLDDFSKNVEEEGLVGAVPEAVVQGFSSVVKAIYGPDANPNDYTILPGSPIPVRVR
jgi:hypothetical protein